MAPQLKGIEDLALSLPPSEREELAQTLLSSLDDEPLIEIDKAWIEVAERRLDDLLNGKVQGIPGEEVMSEIRRRKGGES